MPDQKIRVGILGGGLAGVVLLRGLLLHPQLEVNIYESRPAFKEEGAGIGLQRNAVDSLRAISPALVDALDAAGAVATAGAKILIGCGPNAGTEINRYAKSKYGAIDSTSFVFKNVGRHAFLKELLEGVPENCLHANKKLQSISENADAQESTLHFVDGSTSTVDVVIGADGIHGLVRAHVLGQDNPATTPRFAGWWHTACLVPLAEAQAVLGTEILNVDQPRQHIWVGEHGQAILHDFVHGREWVQCIISLRTGEKPNDPKDTPSEITREEVLAEYANWPERFSKGYVNLMCDKLNAPFRCWPQVEHIAAPTYVSWNAALIGDAAHCTTPWQGSGGAMAIEDALVLSRVLGRAESKAQIPAALKAYDITRRPRSQRTVESSYGTGLLLSGKDPEVGLDMQKLGDAVSPRWDFLRDYDAEEHVAGAVKIMDAEVAQH